MTFDTEWEFEFDHEGDASLLAHAALEEADRFFALSITSTRPASRTLRDKAETLYRMAVTLGTDPETKEIWEVARLAKRRLVGVLDMTRLEGLRHA